MLLTTETFLWFQFDLLVSFYLNLSFIGIMFNYLRNKLSSLYTLYGSILKSSNWATFPLLFFYFCDMVSVCSLVTWNYVLLIRLKILPTIPRSVITGKSHHDQNSNYLKCESYFFFVVFIEILQLHVFWINSKFDMILYFL